MSKSNPSKHPIMTHTRNIKGEYLKGISSKVSAIRANESIATRKSLSGGGGKKK